MSDWPMIPHDGPTFRVIWSAEDQQYVGLCDKYPSLSWLADMAEEATLGIRALVREATDDGMRYDLDDVLKELDIDLDDA